jgi:hypothetical protein
MKMEQKTSKKQKTASESSVPSRSLDGAPRDAVQTCKPPEPENKHAKRTATKRRLTKREHY